MQGLHVCSGRRARLALVWVLVLFVPGLSASVEIFNATVPVIEGDVHRARNEALKQVFLEATSQSGQIDIAARSFIVGNDLRETVQFLTRFRLKSFQLLGQTVSDDSLSITVRIEKEDQPRALCHSLLPLRQFQWLWHSARPNTDPQQDALLNAAMKDALSLHMPDTLSTDPPPDSPKMSLPYTLEGGTEGQHSYFSHQMRLVMTVRGADGSEILRASYPLDHTRITSEFAEKNGMATLKSTVLSRETETAIARFAEAFSRKLACLPTVARIPPASPGEPLRVTTLSNVSAPPTLTVFFSRQWPVMPNGETDLIRLDGMVGIQLSGNANEIALDAPAGDEGRAFATEGGFLLFQ